MTLPQRHDGARLPIDLPDEAQVDPREHIRFFEGVRNVLALVAVIAALVGLYVVTP